MIVLTNGIKFFFQKTTKNIFSTKMTVTQVPVVSIVASTESTIFNKSFESTTFSPRPYIEWNLPVLINAILLGLTIWILFAMVCCGVKRKLWTTKTNKNSFHILNVGWIYTFAVGTGAMGLIRLITSQVAFSTAFGINQERYCESFYDALFAEYCYVFTFVLLVIWFRQRVFYANKLLNMSYNKFLKFLSVGSLPIILTCTNTIVILAFYSQSTKAIPGKGCQRLYKIDLPNWSTAAAVTLFILVELLLILLLLYPLLKSQKTPVFCNRCCAHSNESSVSFPSTTSSQFSSNSEVVKSILKRSVIFGSISIFIQITVILERLTPILHFGSIGLVVLIYDVHVFLLILFVVFSFVNYKVILLSPFSCDLAKKFGYLAPM